METETEAQAKTNAFFKAGFCALAAYSAALTGVLIGSSPQNREPYIVPQTIESVELHSAPADHGILLVARNKSVQVPSIDALVEVMPRSYPGATYALPYAQIEDRAGHPFTTLYVRAK